MLIVGDIYPKLSAEKYAYTKPLGMVAATFFDGQYVLLATNARMNGMEIMVNDYRFIWRSEFGDKDLFFRINPHLSFEPYVFRLVDLTPWQGKKELSPNDVFNIAKLVAECHENWLIEQSEKALQEAVG
jgi:hypothetical protein